MKYKGALINMSFKIITENTYTAVLRIIFLCVFSIITIKYFIPQTIWMVGEFPYPTEYYSLKKILIVTISTIILFIVLFMYYKMIIIKLNNKLTTIVISGYLLIILASEVIISFIAFNPVVGDYAIIKDGIVAFFEGKQTYESLGQFRSYPYNTHIRLIGGYFAQIIGSVDWSMKVLPILTITGSIILNALIVKKVTNFNVAHISIVISLLNVLVYWQAPVFYTHTLVVFFLPATLYAYLCLKSANTKISKVIWWFVLGFLAACTYIIRPTALSVAMAIFFENIFKYRKAQSLKFLSSILFCILLIVGFKSITTTLNLSTDNNVEKVPYSHWIKMGLNEQTYGVWNVPDVTYPDFVKNTEDMDEYNKEIILQRIKDFGVTGYIKHLNEKVERLWVSSQFSSYRLGEWFEQRNDTVTNIVSNFDSRAYKVFSVYSFLIKLFILFGTLAAGILYRKFNENETEVLRICMTSILIVFVFLLLWETAPHYSYEVFAFMNIPASLGLYKLFTMLHRKNIHHLN